MKADRSSGIPTARPVRAWKGWIPDYCSTIPAKIKVFPAAALLCLAIILFPITAEGRIAADKKLHFSAGVLMGSFSYVLGPEAEYFLFEKQRVHPLFWDLGMAALAGAGKEIIYDDMMGRGYADINDFYYTLAGGALSAVVLSIIDSLYDRAGDTIILGINPQYKSISLSYGHRY